jgi:hypothetical protein
MALKNHVMRGTSVTMAIRMRILNAAGLALPVSMFLILQKIKPAKINGSNKQKSETVFVFDGCSCGILV